MAEKEYTEIELAVGDSVVVEGTSVRVVRADDGEATFEVNPSPVFICRDCGARSWTPVV